ncbi:hypothetical protein [Streptomyces sp. NPDC092903]|uniref:hypothetical protein n=1 Tax=Streptomyces sp. NPDC092903 TaxID=3366017 RepID=UPI003820225F
MAFGRNRQVEPFEPEHWDAITQFTVGRMMRRTVRKSTRGEGAHAVRFKRMRGGDVYMVPGVYIVPVDPAVALAKGGFRLFEDEAARQLLCTVLPDGSDRYRVTTRRGRISARSAAPRSPSGSASTACGWNSPAARP